MGLAPIGAAQKHQAGDDEQDREQGSHPDRQPRGQRQGSVAARDQLSREQSVELAEIVDLGFLCDLGGGSRPVAGGSQSFDVGANGGQPYPVLISLLAQGLQ